MAEMWAHSLRLRTYLFVGGVTQTAPNLLDLCSAPALPQLCPDKLGRSRPFVGQRWRKVSEIGPNLRA